MKRFFSIIYGFIIFVIFNCPIRFCQWTTQVSNTTENLRDVCFVDSVHGWAVGGNETIIATIDGGDNWIVQRTLVFDDSSSRGPALTRVQFVNDSIVYAVGEGGTILATKDAGNTWIKQESGISYIIKGLSFISPDTGWVSGCDYVYHEKSIAILLNTTDGGTTWQRFYELPSAYTASQNFFTDVIFIDNFNGWTFQTSYDYGNGTTYVYRTYDGGVVWEEISQIFQFSAIKLKMASVDSIWASGHLYNLGKSFDSGKNWDVYNICYPEFGGVKDVEPLDGKCCWFTYHTLSLMRVGYTEDGLNTYYIVLEEKKPCTIIYALSAIGKGLLWAVGDSGLVMKHEGIIVSVDETEEIKPKIPEDFSLGQNYPNPFNPVTTIKFDILRDSDVTLSIYNILGQKVATW